MTVMDGFRLDGKVALITGGGRGLGRAIAEAYADAGGRIVVASRQLSACEGVVESLEDQGVEALALTLDVTQPDSVREAVSATMVRFGRIDILVNNSGTSWGAPAEEMPLEAWHKVMETNLTGTFLMSQAVAPIMRQQGLGKIVNVASIAGVIGTPAGILDAVGYSASKGGVVALTRDLAVKWARYPIYVNALAPGFFPSKMTRALLEQVGDRIARTTPLGRVGEIEDIKGPALFLASGASNYVTGQVLAVDGGTSAQ